MQASVLFPDLQTQRAQASLYGPLTPQTPEVTTLAAPAPDWFSASLKMGARSALSSMLSVRLLSLPVSLFQGALAGCFSSILAERLDRLPSYVGLDSSVESQALKVFLSALKILVVSIVSWQLLAAMGVSLGFIPMVLLQGAPQGLTWLAARASRVFMNKLFPEDPESGGVS